MRRIGRLLGVAEADSGGELSDSARGDDGSDEELEYSVEEGLFGTDGCEERSGSSEPSGEILFEALKYNGLSTPNIVCSSKE
jgi:hypothetical protein